MEDKEIRRRVQDLTWYFASSRDNGPAHIIKFGISSLCGSPHDNRAARKATVMCKNCCRLFINWWNNERLKEKEAEEKPKKKSHKGNSHFRKGGGDWLGMGTIEGIEENYPAAGYPVPKWAKFARACFQRKYRVHLYNAQKTVSKYLTVYKYQNRPEPHFKVRFSNHKPIPWREAQGDCDFFVGITNQKVTRTEDAWAAMLRHFGEPVERKEF